MSGSNPPLESELHHVTGHNESAGAVRYSAPERKKEQLQTKARRKERTAAAAAMAEKN
jgi:hypothetical protein